MSAQSTLPFAPLTYDEIYARFENARDLCGYRCMAVVDVGGTFEDYDLETLREYATEAGAYQDAADARRKS